MLTPLPWCIHSARLGGGVLAKGCPPPPPSCTFQVWSLLPGFCTHPTDVLGAFKGLARTLGMAISERPDLRPTVCQALRTLIHRGCETGRGLCWGNGGSRALQRPAEGRGVGADGPADPCLPPVLLTPDAERAEVGRFAKNFLPILFNVYSQPQEEGSSSTQRRSVLDTVRAYLTITDPQVRAGAPRALPRFMGKERGSPQQERDGARALMQHAWGLQS